MRLIDADKLYPDRMTNKGNVAISQSQIAKAPTVNAVSEKVYTREYNLRKDAEFKVYKLEKALEQKQKTVLYSGDGYADGYMVYDMAECPNCGYEYEEGDKDWGLPFCPNCGQSLNWESESET